MTIEHDKKGDLGRGSGQQGQHLSDPNGAGAIENQAFSPNVRPNLDGGMQSEGTLPEGLPESGGVEGMAAGRISRPPPLVELIDSGTPTTDTGAPLDLRLPQMNLHVEGPSGEARVWHRRRDGTWEQSVLSTDLEQIALEAIRGIPQDTPLERKAEALQKLVEKLRRVRGMFATADQFEIGSDDKIRLNPPEASSERR